MPSFLKDISRFYGTGEKNAKGQTLEEFLREYDPYKYETPSCTTDAVIFACPGKPDGLLEGLKVLLIRRGNRPSIGLWALPGGFINLRENLEDTAMRELEEETGVKGVVMEQIATYGDYDRDPRSRVITTAYMALVDERDVSVKAGDDAADAVWCGVSLECLKSVQKDGRVWNTYSLKVENEERNLKTEALVEEEEGCGLIRDKKFKVIQPGLIAVDHAAIIVQALALLKKRL